MKKKKISKIDKNRQIDLSKVNSKNLKNDFLSTLGVPKLFRRELPKIFPKKIEIDKLTRIYDFIQNKGNGVFIHGEAGTGKTLMALSSVLVHYNERTVYNFAFIGVADFLAKIRSSFQENSTLDEEDILDKYAGVAFLILDDLGVEKTTEWTGQMLYRLVNRRYENEKITIITSNYSPTQLRQKMGDSRIVSRITSAYGQIKLNTHYRRSLII